MHAVAAAGRRCYAPGVFAGLISTLLLAAMGAPGVALLRRFGGAFNPLEQVAYGLPLGIVVFSLALLGLASPFGLTTLLVALTGAAAACIAAEIWFARPRPVAAAERDSATAAAVDGEQDTAAAPAVADGTGHATVAVGRRPVTRRRRRSRPPWDPLALMRALPLRANPAPLLVVFGFVLLWAHFYANALTERDGALYATNAGHVWADWALHLGHTAGFALAGNFPPANPDFAGHAFNYHYLSSVTAAAMVRLGMSPPAALDLFGFLLMSLLTLGVFAFALRLTRDASASAVALAIFLLGGGLGWVFTIGRMDSSHDLLGTLLRHPWEYAVWQAANFRWETVFLHAVGPQIPFLFGLPLTMLVVTALLAGAARGGRSALGGFLLAGVVAGLLPFAHLGALQALALVTPFLFLLLVRRETLWNWLLFFAVWVAVAVPQIVLLEGGIGGQAAAGLRLDLGWIAAPDANPWFWLKNLGLFLPLLVAALLVRDLLPPLSQRALRAFMPVFVLANLISFQSNDWDNTKALTFWFLAASVLVAALLARAWRRSPSALLRSLLAAVALSLVLSGVLMHFSNILGLDTYQLASAEDESLAAQLQAETPPHALFVTDERHNDPVTMLAGRRTLMAYTGWLWPWGIDYHQRERDVRAIYAYGPDAPRLIQQYGVDFVVFDPTAEQQSGGNLAAYRARYPVLIQTPSYTVFDVRGAR